MVRFPIAALLEVFSVPLQPDTHTGMLTTAQPKRPFMPLGDVNNITVKPLVDKVKKSLSARSVNTYVEYVQQRFHGPLCVRSSLL
jgi:hypothetical protein